MADRTVDRKAEILKAAEQLFAERGFLATTTAEIARHAGVAEGLIFHHFENKEGLLLHIFDDMFSRLNAVAEEAISTSHSGMQALENLIHVHFSFLREHTDKMHISLRDLPMHDGRLSENFRKVVRVRAGHRVELLASCVQRGGEDGSMRPVPVRPTALTVAGMLFGVTHIMMHGLVQMPPMEDEVITFVRRSLAPEHVEVRA